MFLKYISAPIKTLLENNRVAMNGLQNAINKLNSDLKDNDYKWANSQAHRDRLQAGQDKHEERIGVAEDKLISHEEQLKTLWKEKVDKR
ncbi:hypothetical protein Javan384_0003 [Streptococcus phage Javan384]|nr:hypothetical protein Javan383_0003 [Streptococcus phage Javan383]QBX27338.1 hypothetical protein Javan384_0003 [Streptococcus phage Javan384]